MNMRSSNVIIAEMTPKERPAWTNKQKQTSNRLLRNTALFAAGSFCLGLCVWAASSKPERAEAVMSHLTSGFEYDETLGRLQLVSNMLPESAMVFLSTDNAPLLEAPVLAEVVHAWSEQEPWVEYDCAGEVLSCGSGEVMTIVKNHAGMHTVRILHDDGYESIYSGLKTVHANEHDFVRTGDLIGVSTEKTAFELRKDGVSVLPAFAES